MQRVLRIDEVIRITGLSRSTLWRLERSGRFPARQRLGDRATGFSEHQVSEWIERKFGESNTRTTSVEASSQQVPGAQKSPNCRGSRDPGLRTIDTNRSRK